MKLQVATTRRSGTGKLFLDQIRDLLEEFRVAIDVYNPDDPWTCTLEQWWTDGRTLLLLEEDGTLYAMLAFDKSVQADTAYISSLCVVAAHRGQGHGTTLLTEAKRYFKSKGYKSVTIGVDAANGVAKKMYEELGFEIEYLGMKCRL